MENNSIDEIIIIRPRLNDFYNLSFSQADVDFAIPFLEEDIPMYLDPFLLWKSPSIQDTSLHMNLVSSLNQIGQMVNKNRKKEAEQLLIQMSECKETGLGTAKNKIGHKISIKTAEEILQLYKSIPQIKANGIFHSEEIQLFVEGFSKDRLSDLSCNILKSFLIDYTIDQCKKHKVPMSIINRIDVYDHKRNIVINERNVTLPVNPRTNLPIILIPKRWLRYMPWISYEDYFKDYFVKDIENIKKFKNKIDILNYNRKNYSQVSIYIKNKEKESDKCKNDPFFQQIPIHLAKRKVKELLKLQTGKSDNADKKYEELVSQVLISFLYPQLDFAQTQSRTDSGVLIRDLFFYNNRGIDFLSDIYSEYRVKQVIFELKNVKELESQHINQINRYVSGNFGSFGILVTRNEPKRKIIKNLIDLWSGQRKCILVLTDSDIEMMLSIYEEKQRLPIDVIKKKYIEFERLCPS